MEYFTKREQILILVIVLLVASVSILSLLNKKGVIGPKVVAEDPFRELDEEVEDGTEENQDLEEEFIMVHICGAVKNPGIIELEGNSRVIDGINLAGGLKSTADSDRINLARILLDEEKVYIPKIGEEPPIEISGLNNLNPDNNSKEAKVNINTCTKEELMSLTGIGEVIAERILDYREEHLFKTLDDIKNVSGIGDKKYENIKEFITVK